MDPANRGEVASFASDVSSGTDLLREILHMAAGRDRPSRQRHPKDFAADGDGS
jgi:hypothetical protein